MSQPTLFEIPDAGTQLAKFQPADAAIAELATQYMTLKLANTDDAGSYKMVKAARIRVKNYRCDVEKTRKELKADALDYGRRVDAEAKRITALLTPIEDHLSAEEKRYDDARESERLAIVQAEENKRREEAEALAAKLKAEADAKAAEIKRQHDAEAERLRLERENIEAERKIIAEQQRAEQERLAAERKVIEDAQAAERARLKAQQDAIDAERRKIEAEKADAKRLADLEQARKDAAEQARLDTEARIAREAAEAQATAEREEEARNRAEALRPDRDRLLALADAIQNMPIPKLSPVGMKWTQVVENILVAAACDIRDVSRTMHGEDVASTDPDDCPY